VDIDRNMLLAATHSGVPGGWPFWFYYAVRNHVPWDYKQEGSQYENFGNFNFGATGLEGGFDEKTLLRGGRICSTTSEDYEFELGQPWKHF
jgi:hypothetical protein